MADTNKVLFGFSDLYIGTFTVSDAGVVSMGTPYHQKGAVGFSPEENSDQEVFYADNVPYYTTYSTGTYEGDLTVAKFDDTFKKNFLGYVELDDGGLAQIKGATRPNIYIMFEIQGDQHKRRAIFYNGSLGAITREYNTIEENRTPVTESISVTFTGDNGTGITKVTYNEGDTGYETLFSAPPVPTLPSAS